MPEKESPALCWTNNLSENERFNAKHRLGRSSAVLGEFVLLHNINKINGLPLSKMTKNRKEKLFLLTFWGFYGMILQTEKKKKI